MKFKKQFLKDLAYDDNKHAHNVQVELIDHGRWSLHYEAVFEFEGKFYSTTYSKGATEIQDEQPYEYDDDEIECPEVFKKEKTIIVYE